CDFERGWPPVPCSMRKSGGRLSGLTAGSRSVGRVHVRVSWLRSRGGACHLGRGWTNKALPTSLLARPALPPRGFCAFKWPEVLAGRAVDRLLRRDLQQPTG